MTNHLDTLRLRLSNERVRLTAAKSANEIELRKVWIAGIEKEIAQEEDFLQLHDSTACMTDDELLAELEE